VRDLGTSVGDTVTGLVAELMGLRASDLPRAGDSGDEWLAVLRQRLAAKDCGLVSIASPDTFSWPGHWIGIVDSPGSQDEPVGVLLFGSPSAVIASPSAPELVGRGVEELTFRQGLILVPIDPFATRVPRGDRTVGAVEGIYVSPAKEAPMRSVPVATAVPHRGLAGDRYEAKAGTFTPKTDRLRGYDITLIEREVLDRQTLPDGRRLSPEESRRNILTSGIDLNALVGREFRIGSVRAFGQRLCEPCVHLQRLTRPGVVVALVHKGGLRADLLGGGDIRIGDRIEATK
jgi:hypothetical protein